MAVKTKQPGRARRILRRALLVIVLLSLSVAAAGYHFTRPHRIASFASQLLERLTGADVAIESASFSLDGTVMLHGLALTVPGLEGEGGELFHAETALLKLDPYEAIRGNFDASELLVFRPTLSLTEIGPDRFNYEQLRRERETVDGPMPHLPRVYVRDGRVRYGEVHDGQYRKVGALHVGGRLDPDADRPGLYHFEFSPQPEDYAVTTDSEAGPLATVVHPTLRGSFDLETLWVNVELEDFAFVDPHRNMLPRQMRRWWDMFEPSGSLPNTRFDYDPVTGPTATVHVEGVSLSLPQLSGIDYEARMSDVSGTFHFDAHQIRVENLVGQIEGLQYRINGIIDGYRTESPFQLSLDTRPFRIPEEPQFMPALPLDVQEVFNQLSPVGWMRVSLVLRRNTPDAEIDYQGSATILSGRWLVRELMRDPQWRAKAPLDADDPQFSSSGSYQGFPYPMHNARGMVTFNSDELVVRNLTGNTPGGGEITITGTVGPLNSEARVDLHIAAKKLPFDDTLREALRENQRKIVDMFFDEQHHQRLHEAGHFATSAEHEAARDHRNARQNEQDQHPPGSPEHAAAADQLAEAEAILRRPVFDLGGELNVNIKLQRELTDGDGGDGLTTAIELENLNVVFEHFPYPVIVTEGELVIGDGGLSFEVVRARGINGGEAVLSGRVDIPDNGGADAITPRLTLKTDSMPVDALLLDVLPKPHNQWLAQLNPSGAFSIDGRILRDPLAKISPPIGIDMAIAFEDVTIAPGQGRYPLTDVGGNLRLTLHELEILAFEGRHDDADLHLTGHAEFAGEDGVTLSLSGRGTNMRLEDHVLDLLAPAVGENVTLETFWEERNPAGVFDVDFDYQAGGEDGETAYALEMHPSELAFDHEGHRISLGDVTGSVNLNPGTVKLNGLAGRFDDDEHAIVNGTVTLGAEPSARMSLSLHGNGMGPTLQHLAPDSVSEVLESAGFAGRYHLDAPLIEVTLRDEKAHDARLLARLDLEDVQFDFGLPVTQLHGWLNVDVEHFAEEQAWPTITLKLNAPQLHASGRKVTDLALTLRNQPGTPYLAVSDLQARLAGGGVTGRGSVDLEAGRFQLELALAEARLRSLIAAVATEPTTTELQTEARTVTVANLPAREPLPAPNTTGEHERPTAELDEIDESNAIDGSVSLSLAIDGGWKDNTPIRGRGDLTVRDANLRGLPLAMGLLQMAHLTLPADQTFERAISSYYIRGDEIVFEQLELDAPGMRIGGTGSVNYRSRAVDLTLTTSNPAGLNLGPLTTLIDGFRNQLVTLRVTGTTEEPRLQVRQLDGVSEAWRDVFGND